MSERAGICRRRTDAGTLVGDRAHSESANRRIRPRQSTQLRDDGGGGNAVRGQRSERVASRSQWRPIGEGWCYAEYHESVVADSEACRNAESCRPSAKLLGDNQASSSAPRAGHSLFRREYIAMSRGTPFSVHFLRKTPSNVNPKRSAARRDRSFSAVQVHSSRPYPSPKAYCMTK